MFSNNIVRFVSPRAPTSIFKAWTRMIDAMLELTPIVEEQQLRWVLLLSSIVKYGEQLSTEQDEAIANIHHWQQYVLACINASHNSYRSDREEFLRSYVIEGYAIACQAFGMPKGSISLDRPNDTPF